MQLVTTFPARPARQPLALPSLMLRSELWLVAVTLLGLALRLAWVQSQDTVPLGGDARWYHTVATNVAEGRGYVIDWNEQDLEVAGPGRPTAFWPPGYPVALGAAYRLAGNSIETAKLLNVVLGTLAIPLVFALGHRLFDARAGLLGAAVFAVLPEPILVSSLVVSEPLFVALFLGGLVVLVRPAGSRPRLLDAVVFGGLAGLAALTRGQGLVLLPVAGLYLLARDGLFAAGRWLTVATLACAAVLAPWTVRNAIVMDGFVPIATSAGINLRIGHAPDAPGRVSWPDRIEASDGPNTILEAMQPDEELRRSAIYSDRALDYAGSHPREELALAGRKLGWLFRMDEGDLLAQVETAGWTPVQPDRLARLLPGALVASHYGLLALAALALPFTLLRRRSNAALLVALVGCWSLFHVVFFAEPRYHLPLLPVCALAAAWLLTRVPPRLPQFERRPAAARFAPR